MNLFEHSMLLLGNFRDSYEEQSKQDLKLREDELYFQFDTDFSSVDPGVLNNKFVDSLYFSYVSKCAELSKALYRSIDENDYLVYAMSGRALIELTAILYYYLFHKYRPIVDSTTKAGKITVDDYTAMLKVHEKHLRGSRFNWGKFVQGGISELVEDYSDPKNKIKINFTEQVNVMTCIQKYDNKDTKGALMAYSLFSDLVHPNIGSALLVTSVSEDGKMYHTKHMGKPTGRSIVVQTLPMLMAMTFKNIPRFLELLIAVKFPPEQTRH